MEPTPPPGLLQLIYSSQPFGYDEATLAGILMDARRCNSRDGVTGALICRRDVYLQLVEGPEPAVRAAYARIARDDRHLDVVLHVALPVSERLFGAWAMLHDPAVSWLPPDADGGLERLRATDVRRVFTALAARSVPGTPA
jgi:hypothetical protein